MINRTLSHYKVREEISRGGMGIVCKALDLKLNREVALKVLPPELVSDPDRKRRFIQEAQAAAALNHPNIAVVYEIDEVDGVDFIAMELIEGEKLSDLLQRGTVTLEQAVRIVTEVADGLAKAHSKGIVHRDINPSNIMVTEDGHIKIIDFGLAKLVEPLPEEAAEAQTRARRETSVGQIMGTLAYMSPEQARGQDVDHRNDIFSLGVVLYEMLTGDLPFTAPSAAEVPHAIINDPAPSLPSASPSHVVEKCLAKDPADRYQTADELAADLRYGKRGATKAKRWGLPGAVTAVGVLVLGFFFFRPSFETSGEVINSLAVLPFENTRNDPHVEYLSDGIPESLINRLSQVPQLRVMARSSAFRFRDPRADPQAIGRELKVGAVLTGRVVQQGDRLNVQAELVDVENGMQLWGRQYEHELVDLLTVQNDLAAEISQALSLKISGAEQTRIATQTVDSEAYQAYLRGRFHWRKRTNEDFSKAIEFFDEARLTDPDYALAYAGLADSYFLLGGQFYGADENYAPADAIAQARRSALEALRLDEDLAEPPATLAFIRYAYDWDGAEADFLTAIERDPHYVTARRWYALYLSLMQRSDDAIEQSRRDVELAPTSPLANRGLGTTYLAAGMYEEGIEQFEAALELAPEFPLLREQLMDALWAHGEREKAVVIAEAYGRISARFSDSCSKGRSRKLATPLPPLPSGFGAADSS